MPSPDYIAAGQKLALSQIAKGGYRLADLIVQIYGGSAKKDDSKFLTE